MLHRLLLIFGFGLSAIVFSSSVGQGSLYSRDVVPWQIQCSHPRVRGGVLTDKSSAKISSSTGRALPRYGTGGTGPPTSFYASLSSSMTIVFALLPEHLPSIKSKWAGSMGYVKAILQVMVQSVSKQPPSRRASQFIGVYECISFRSRRA